MVSEAAGSKSKKAPRARRLKIFERITTSDGEENQLESEKHNDN
jgi:hypothetical protein